MELAEFLNKRIKHAVKSVFFNRAQYFCFFVAMFVVEIFCGLVVIASYNSARLEYKYVTERYPHHLELRNMNEDQYYYMENDIYTVFANQHIYDKLKVESRADAVTGEKYYTYYIKFVGDPDESYHTFINRYMRELNNLADENGGKYDMVLTPLFDVNDRIAINNAFGVLAFLLVAALSVALIMTLYNIRINHYRFEYGIYMAFGADFRRLMSVCVWEMLVVSVVVYLPSLICSWLISFAVYKLAGQSYEYYPWTPIIVLAFALVVALLSVATPVWRLSRRTPRANILAEDNSNLVASPRISFEMLTKTYPRGYELISGWRFRKYLLKLFVTVSLFAAAFTSLIYATGLVMGVNDCLKNQFYLNFYDDITYDGGTEGGFMHEELMEFPGVTGIVKAANVTAMQMSSHIVFSNKNVKFGVPTVYFSDTERATNRASYNACDSEVIESYLSQYEIEGDPYSALKNERTVIVSPSQWNFTALNLKPGDKIKVAKKIYGPALQLQLTGHKLLMTQLDMAKANVYKFEYTEYTVGAVVKNLPSSYNIEIFFSPEDYAELTGTEAVYKSIGIYADPNLSYEEIDALRDELDRWGDYYLARVSSSTAILDRNIAIAKRVPTFIIAIAVLLLAMTPLVWFFAQILFMFKREGEFTVLLALGAIMDEIKKQCVYDGILAAAVGGAVNFIVTVSANYLTYFLSNHLLFPFMANRLRVLFVVPWAAVAAGCAISILCAFFSCVVPFYLFKRRVQLISVSEPEDI